MKTALTLAPILLVLAVPAVLPNPTGHYLKSVRPPVWTGSSSGAIAIASASTTTSIFTPATKPNSTYVWDGEGTVVIIEANGTVIVNWKRARKAAVDCYAGKGSTIGWQACALVQSMVATRNHQTKVLP